jgi:hypothetical protein
VVEGMIERTEKRERKRKQMLDDFKETRRDRIERGSTTSHSEENSLWKRLWNCTWTLRAVDQKHLESFEMWCWRRMEKISWTDRVRNEVLLRVSEQRNILHEIRKRKANWIGHILRRNCLLKEVTEGKIKGRIEVTRRRGRRRKHLLDDLGDRRGYSHLKEEALDRIKWRDRFGRGCGPVV